jgi:hypothetical protein
MTVLRRLRISWDGLGGLPGLTTFYYGVASPNVSDAVTFFTALRTYVPSGVTWTIPSQGDELDDVTGQLTGGWVGTGGGTVTSTGTVGSYPAGTGLLIRWNTGVVASGRRIQGRTFICPLTSAGYANTGVVATSTATPVLAAATAFAASGVAKGIWHQPKKAPGGIGPDRPGQYAAIQSASVSTTVSSLRSRRT